MAGWMDLIEIFEIIIELNETTSKSYKREYSFLASPNKNLDHLRYPPVFTPDYAFTDLLEKYISMSAYIGMLILVFQIYLCAKCICGY